MKLFKKFIFFLLSIILIISAGILYDLSYYDPSYINRNSITFKKNNLNSKKVKKTIPILEKYYYNLNRKLFSEQRDFWKIEDASIRKNLPEIIKIKGKKNNFLPGTNLNKLEKNFSNWFRSHGGFSSMTI